MGLTEFSTQRAASGKGVPWIVGTWLSLATMMGHASGESPLFIIGQDLGTVRDYYASGCCPRADGSTFYLVFFDLLDPEKHFGGLGIDPEGSPVDQEPDLGSGPQNGYRTAMEFPEGVAIGLQLVENNHPGALDRLLAGDYDSHIDQLSRFLRIIDKRTWLRVGYEFDGVWNRGYEDRQRYKAVFRYLVDGLRSRGVNHVEYVWQGSSSPVDDVLDQGREDIRDWYPGDGYVDWVGASWFLSADEKPLVNSAYAVPTQRLLMDELAGFAREKGLPLMIAEAAPQGYDLGEGTYANISPVWDGPSSRGRTELSPGEIWARWYAPLFRYLEENRDVVRALAYINTHWDSQRRWGAPYQEGYWGDSRLQANPAIALKFTAAIEGWRNRVSEAGDIQ